MDGYSSGRMSYQGHHLKHGMSFTKDDHRLSFPLQKACLPIAVFGLACFLLSLHPLVLSLSCSNTAHLHFVPFLLSYNTVQPCFVAGRPFTTPFTMKFIAVITLALSALASAELSKFSYGVYVITQTRH
jgi:hypothetical protein